MAAPRKTAQGTWRVDLQVGGVRDSKTLATRREALEWRDARTAELRAQAKGHTGTVKTLRDALRLYAETISPTKRGGSKETIRLKAFEGAGHAALPVNRKLADVQPDDIARWRDARLLTTARGSVLRDMTLLSSVFEAARLEWRWISTNPVRDVRKPAQPDHRTRTVTDAEIAAMQAQLGHQPGAPVRSMSQAVAVAMLLALATGMRAGELCSLTWTHVHADHVVLPITKNGKRRDVPLTPEARALIELARGFDDVLVLGLSAQTLDALFRRARQRAGLDGFTFHDLRHTAATRLAPRLSVLDLCRMFGWAKADQALTYYNPSAGEIAKRLAA